MPKIDEVDLYNPKYAFQGRHIGPSNLEVDFSITVEDEGCYAIAVSVWDDDDLSGRDLVATSLTSAKLPCLCFQKGETRKFAINGDHGAGAAPTPETGRTQLGPLVGDWPASDGPFDDDLELYVTIELYLCKATACDPAKPDECRWLNTGRLDEDSAVARYDNGDAPQTTTVANGTGWQEGWGLIEKVATAAAGAAKSVAMTEKDGEAEYLALALRERKRTARGLLAVRKRLAVLERRQPG